MPIVEPEVLMDGEHTIERSLRGHVGGARRALRGAVPPAGPPRRHAAEAQHGAVGVLAASQQASVQEVAEATVRCFRATVPAAVPGIVFLSGGQSDELATAHLNAMNQLGGLPWQLSFSYGRALQAPALKAWKGETANVDAGRNAFLHRAKLNSAARSGSYTTDMEKAAPS